MPYDVKTEIDSEWPMMLRLSKLYADPLRVKILSECQMRAMSPRSFFAEFGGISLDRISRAFDVLVQYDWIGPVDAPGQPGGSSIDAADQLYRTIDTPIMDEEMVAEVPGPMRTLVSVTIFESLADRVKEAAEAGTLEARPDQHNSWTPLALDQLGWEKVISKLDALFYSLSQEQQDADARMAESGEAAIPMTVALMGFESPKKPDPLG